MYKNYVKRLLDILLSLFALLVLGLPMLVLALVIRVTIGSPVLFRQQRVGKGDKPFSLMKFRSMTDARDANGVYLPDEERITKLGHLLRTTSLDELPELFNILRGDMSIIGPRPLPVRYLDRYTPQQRRRHEVRPGLSCPSIIDGRNTNTWERQFEGDVWYVDHLSFWTDLHCVLHTFHIVLTRKGATAEEGISRGEFIGTANVEDLKHDHEGNYMKL